MITQEMLEEYMLLKEHLKMAEARLEQAKDNIKQRMKGGEQVEEGKRTATLLYQKQQRLTHEHIFESLSITPQQVKALRDSAEPKLVEMLFVK